MITGHTKLIGLLGSPVAHSISPLMHNEAFRLLGLDYAYLCFEAKEDQLENAVKAMKALDARGFNCTMPAKVRMYELADKLSPAAELMEAVNTVVIDDGIMTGHNTDGIGYMTSLKEAGYHVIGKKMILLGSGGAAVAIAVQAALDGVAEIALFCRRGRSWQRAQHFTDLINARTNCKVSLYETADNSALRNELSDSYLLTNATSVGMAPNTNISPIENISILPDNIIVSDVIYNPRETKLLAEARARGLRTLNGLYMLLYQGAEAFHLWTGHPMPVDEIKTKFFSV